MTENLSAFGQLHASLRTADMSYADSVDEFARQAQATVERSSAEQGALCEKAVGNHDATKKVLPLFHISARQTALSDLRFSSEAVRRVR